MGEHKRRGKPGARPTLDFDPTSYLASMRQLIQAHKAALGLSFETLGALCGMTRSGISRMLKGQHNPSVETLLYLCQALHIQVGPPFAPAGQESLREHRIAALVGQLDDDMQGLVERLVDMLVTAQLTRQCLDPDNTEACA